MGRDGGAPDVARPAVEMVEHMRLREGTDAVAEKKGRVDVLVRG